MKKLFLYFSFVVLLFFAMLNVQMDFSNAEISFGPPEAFAAAEVICWPCGTDICDNGTGFVCCWSSFGGYKNNCNIEN